MTITAGLIGAAYSNITNYINLMGGFCGVITGFFFPAFIYVVSSNKKVTDWSNIRTITFCGLFSIVGLFSAVLSVIDVINGKKSAGH